MEICVLVTQDIFEAELVKSRLEDVGIPSLLKSNDASGMLPHLRNAEGIKLYVAEDDAEEAQKVLKNLSRS